ncbi:MAG: type II 3-dehydroquinate dehydratase [Pseudomonadota bacterium]
MARILLINGPNLNLLGSREPDIYGSETLTDIENRLRERAQALGLSLSSVQSNHEGALVDAVHQARADTVDFVLINPGAFTHTSIALRDAFLSVQMPFIEIHLSNIFARESFRHHSYLSDIAVGTVIGLGPVGYELALDAAARRLA